MLTIVRVFILFAAMEYCFVTHMDTLYNVNDIAINTQVTSPKITVREQTFENEVNKSGINTIAAKFYDNKKNKSDDILIYSDKNLTITLPKQLETSYEINVPESQSETLQTVLETIELPVTNNKAKLSLEQAQNVLKKVTGTAIPIQITADLTGMKTNASNISIKSTVLLEQLQNTVQIIINLTGVDTNAMNVSVVLPKQFLNDVAQQKNISLEINASHLGTVILSQKSMHDLVNIVQGDVEITLQK